MKPGIREAQLHAYVDGELSDDVRVAVEAHLREHEEQAEQVRAWRAQNEALHRRFDAVLDEPHDLRLPPAAIERRRNRWRGSAFAIAASLLLGVAIGYVGRAAVDRPSASQSLPRQALAAHAVYVAEVRHPVEVGAAEHKHLLAWLSKRLAAPLRAPDLQAAGFALLGGRLLPPAGEVGSAPVAQLMYENAQGKRLTLLVRREPTHADTAFRFVNHGATNVFYWFDGPFGYALSGEVERDALASLARLVYQQLNP